MIRLRPGFAEPMPGKRTNSQGMNLFVGGRYIAPGAGAPALELRRSLIEFFLHLSLWPPGSSSHAGWNPWGQRFSDGDKV